MSDRHPWMQIAYSSRDLRRIVGQDKLAIVIGSEIDDIGNFAWSSRGLGALGPLPSRGRGIPKDADVTAEIRRLARKGVRYIFPVHVIDNHFGGTAIYESAFPAASKYQFGRWPEIICARPSDGITKRIGDTSPSDFEGVIGKMIAMHVLGGAGENTPLPPNCPRGVGYTNRRGLQPLGKVALTEMMKAGMIIDIDHMSQRTAQDTIRFTARTPGGAYPLASGHNGLRAGFESGRLRCRPDSGRCTPEPEVSENTRTPEQYEAIAKRSGVVAIGWGDSNARDYVANVRKVTRLNRDLSINIGSDINGLVNQPSNKGCGGSCVTYSKSFPRLVTGGRTWDYKKDGVAHIGLFPDFLRHVESKQIGGGDVVNKLFNGAEGFAKMWERAEAVSRRMR